MWIVERTLLVSIALASVAWVARRIGARSTVVASRSYPSDLSIDEPNRGERPSKRAEEVFSIMDENSNGARALAELGTYMRLAGANPTQAEVERFIEQLRQDGKHVFTAQELGAVLEWHYKEQPYEKQRSELEDAWEIVDSDGDGMVRGAEMGDLVYMLTHLGEPLSDEEMSEFLKDMDINEDGILSRREFMTMLDH